MAAIVRFLISYRNEQMPPQFQLHREPFRATLLRNGIIASVAGAVLAQRWGGFSHWPIATLLAVWPSFGGHYVEIFYLNGLRPRIPAGRFARSGTRLGVWFLGGIALAAGMGQTAALAGVGPRHWPAWWTGGAVFVGIELVVHMALQLRGRPSFYSGE